MLDFKSSVSPLSYLIFKKQASVRDVYTYVGSYKSKHDGRGTRDSPTSRKINPKRMY